MARMTRKDWVLHEEYNCLSKDSLRLWRRKYTERWGKRARFGYTNCGWTIRIYLTKAAKAEIDQWR